VIVARCKFSTLLVSEEQSFPPCILFRKGFDFRVVTLQPPCRGSTILLLPKLSSDTRLNRLSRVPIYIRAGPVSNLILSNRLVQTYSTAPVFYGPWFERSELEICNRTLIDEERAYNSGYSAELDNLTHLSCRLTVTAPLRVLNMPARLFDTFAGNQVERLNRNMLVLRVEETSIQQCCGDKFLGQSPHIQRYHSV